MIEKNELKFELEIIDKIDQKLKFFCYIHMDYKKDKLHMLPDLINFKIKYVANVLVKINLFLHILLGLQPEKSG